MKKYFYILPILLAIGCIDKLDVKPLDTVESKDALKTSADVEGLLVGAYNALGDVDLLGGNLQRDAELMGDAGGDINWTDQGEFGEIFWDGTFVAPGEIYTKSMLITNDQARATWLDAYYCINICNLVIKNLDLVSDVKKQRVEAEAKFIRGLVYFELVRVFARTYIDGNPTNNPGVPIVTENSEQFALIPRNSVEEVYDQVIQDLTFAAENLPAKNNFFATKFSARGILSRVYLMQNNYADALANADSVITRGEFSLAGNFDEAFNKTSLQNTGNTGNGNATKEDVFAIQVTSQDGGNSLNTFFADALYGGRGDIFIDFAHYDLFEPNDERGRLYEFDDDGFPVYTSKFNNQFGNVPIVRLAEMYLTRAECNFRLTSNVGATPLDDINTIRRRAKVSDFSIINNVNEILLERRRELAFEGHQIHDLKRTQRNIGTLSFDDPFLIFPIPQREILIFPELEQNEAYQ